MRCVMLLTGAETIKIEGTTDNNSISSVEFLSTRESQDIDGPSGKTVKIIKITGKIENDTKDATCKLLNWSFKTTEKESIMTLKITIDNGEDANVREYTLNNMYCLSYKEDFANLQSGDVKFELIMRQKAQQDTTVQAKSQF